ncbi:MAG: MFS transporter [Chloroflexi bacterium]|nr:MFS transporter [Chloroflexota bacterium]
MSVTTEAAEGPFIDEKQRGRWVLISTISASSMAFISQSSLNLAIPAIQEVLGANGTQVLWIVNIYSLLLSALILVGGSLGDHLGRKRIFMVGIGIFGVASFLCGIAPNPNLLIAARAFQGVGGALMIPGSLAIITAYFDDKSRGRAIGTWSAATTIVNMLGPALGGFLVDQGLWRAVFFINIPLGIIALIVLFRVVPESFDEEASPQLDYLGAILATAGLAGIVYGFTEAPRLGFDSPLILGTLVGGVLAMIAFVYVEANSDHPMMSLSLFKSRTFSGTNLLTLFLYGALYVVGFFFNLNLLQAQGYDALIAGITFLPFGIVLAGLSPWAGSLVDRIGPRLPLIVGPIVAGIGMILLGLPGITAGASDYWTTYFPGILVYSFGMALVVAPLTATVMGSVSQHYAGTASGINNAVSRTAGVLAVAIFGAVALITYNSAITTNSADLGLAEDVRAEVIAQSENLGAAMVPDSVPAELVEEVDLVYKESFVGTFRLVAFSSAGLAFLSAIMTAIFVRNDAIRDEQDEVLRRPHEAHH